MKSIIIIAFLLISFRMAESQCTNATLTNCANCVANAAVCSNCLGGYILATTSTCVTLSSINCQTASNFQGCLTCPVGFGLQVQPAANVAPNNLTKCVACNNASCCNCQANYLNCNTNFIFQDQTNQACVDTSLWNCNGPAANYIGCSSCTAGMGLNFSTYLTTSLASCSKCIDGNCNQCSTNCISCQTCASGYVSYGINGINGCASCQELNCPSGSCSNSGCTSCGSNQFLASSTYIQNLNQCFSCNATCTSCSTYQWCNTCIQGFQLTVQGTGVRSCVYINGGLLNKVFTIFTVLAWAVYYV